MTKAEKQSRLAEVKAKTEAAYAAAQKAYETDAKHEADVAALEAEANEWDRRIEESRTQFKRELPALEELIDDLPDYGGRVEDVPMMCQAQPIGERIIERMCGAPTPTRDEVRASQLRDLRSANREKESEHAKLERQLKGIADLKARIEAETVPLEAQHEVLNSEIGTLDSSISAQKDIIANLTGRPQLMSMSERSMPRPHFNMDDDDKNLQYLIDKLDAKLNAMRSGLEQMAETRDKKQKELKDLKNEVRALRSSGHGNDDLPSAMEEDLARVALDVSRA